MNLQTTSLLMNWLPQAEAEIRKAPFFVRKKARKRVEEHVAAEGREVVTAAVGKAVKKRFLTRMDDEVKGFQVEACFGAQGCPNRLRVRRVAAKAGKISCLAALSGVGHFLGNTSGGF